MCLYQCDDPTVTELVADMDEALFAAVVHNDKHVLRYILPERRNVSYSLGPRRHEFTSAIKGDARNFLERLLFRDILVFCLF